MDSQPRFVLVTGYSGAGKSEALHAFEDLGYYSVDNLPVALVPTFADLVVRAGIPHRDIALCVDARSGTDIHDLPGHLDRARQLGLGPEVVFLETSPEVLQQRYSSSRRRHPASPRGGIEDGIRLERELLGPLRDAADVVINTTVLGAAELRDRIAALFTPDPGKKRLVVTVLSFGFKHGLPLDADMVFDLRFLPNPHYDAELRPLTGEDQNVRDVVLNSNDAQEYLRHVKSLLKFVAPKFENERKSYLTLAFGCTGGRHRSVTFAHEILRLLRDLGYDARIRHRDITKQSE